MTEREIHALIDQKRLPHDPESVKLIETHISWVILADDHVYKIKKPVQFSFLDFTTPEKRKHYCEQEVRLNRRLAPEVYLGVLPIMERGDGPVISAEASPPIDYAVYMKKLDPDRQMHLMLERGEVTTQHIRAIADQLAKFHQNARVIKDVQRPKEIVDIFDDILNSESQLERILGKDAVQYIRSVCQEVSSFFKWNAQRALERISEGFIRDCHGDLHTQNIFLTDRPVIFDCIEFNPELREIDVLNEIAFLGMDLDLHGRHDLSDALIRYYNSQFRCIRNAVDERIYAFYKLHRANVRMKVLVLQSTQVASEGEWSRTVVSVRKYFTLFKTLFETFKHAKAPS